MTELYHNISHCFVVRGGQSTPWIPLCDRIFIVTSRYASRGGGSLLAESFQRPKGLPTLTVLKVSMVSGSSFLLILKSLGPVCETRGTGTR